MMYSALLIMSDELNNICRPRVTKSVFVMGILFLIAKMYVIL